MKTNKKRILLLIICSLAFTTYGQDCNIINLDRFFAKGEVVNLPDSIYLFDNETVFGPFENYSVLRKIKKNHFEVMFWLMENGGIVDPALYRKELIIKKNNESIELEFNSLRARYICQEKLIENKRIILLKKINNR